MTGKRGRAMPLAIDLYCGLGGWTEGLLAEGFAVIGFDIERHDYGTGGYPAQLVLQDVTTIDGAMFKDAALIVASPPCQEYSYMAMPWNRAKAKAAAIRADERGAELARLNRLFDACFRIQREACEAAGRKIPMVVENVCGAQKWVGRARWHFGSFYLWGDVPALMPITAKAVKVPTMGAGWYPPDHPKHIPGLGFNTHADRLTKNPGFRFDGSGRSFQSESVDRVSKNTGGSWFNVAHNTPSGKGRNPDGLKVPSESGRRTDPGKGARFTSRDCGIEGTKQPGIGGTRANGKGDGWFQDGAAQPGSKSNARKRASAEIAKIPLTLSRWIASYYYPAEARTEAR